MLADIIRRIDIMDLNFLQIEADQICEGRTPSDEEKLKIYEYMLEHGITDISYLLGIVDRCSDAMKQIVLELGSPGENPAVSVQKVIEIADGFITEP